ACTRGFRDAAARLLNQQVSAGSWWLRVRERASSCSLRSSRSSTLVERSAHLVVEELDLGRTSSWWLRSSTLVERLETSATLERRRVLGARECFADGDAQQSGVCVDEFGEPETPGLR